MIMASLQQAPQSEKVTQNANPVPGNRRTYLRVFLFATILPVIAFCAAFPLVCSRSYEDWGETQWGPELEFPYASGTPDADVVVFGDSSAFLGIDPRIVNAQLGIHSVVLPSTVGSLPVIGDTPLQTYLAHHKKPKVIVLYFSAWNLDFQHVAKGRLFEGEEMLMRHGTPGQIAHFELSHPLELLEFPLRVFSTFGPKMVTAILHHKSRPQEIASALGHTPYVEKFGSLTDLCEIPASYLNARGNGSVEELRQRYESYGAKVIVYIAPVPHCVNSRAVSKLSFAGLGAAAPKQLPPTYFAADTYYAHIRPSAVPLATEAFASSLKETLQQVAPELLHADGVSSGTGPVAEVK